MDTYDLKPDAAAEFRGEFNPIATNVPGVRICELFPGQARMWDKLACIRSIVSVEEHSDAITTTGYNLRQNTTANHPSFGSVVSRIRTTDASAVPQFVSLRTDDLIHRGEQGGFLGVSHRAFTPRGPDLENLRPLTIDASQFDQRRRLLENFDGVRREIDANMVSGLDFFTARAFEMIAHGGVRNALDLNRETPAVRHRYQGVESFLVGAVWSKRESASSPWRSGAGIRTSKTSAICVATCRCSISVSPI